MSQFLNGTFENGIRTVRGFLYVTEFNENWTSEALEDAIFRSGLRFLVRRRHRLPNAISRKIFDGSHVYVEPGYRIRS